MTRAALLAACLTLHPASAAPPDTSAKTFVERLYRSYAAPNAPSVLGKRADTIFAPDLLAKIRADQTRHEGEVGKLDHDPICDCQDPDGLKPLAITMTLQTRHDAKASVRFKLADAIKSLRLTLIRTQAGWRVADVVTHTTPSLRAQLATP